MRQRQGTVTQTLRNVDDMIVSTPELAPLASSPARQTLTGTITKLATLSDTQGASSVGGKGETANQKSLRRVLRRHMDGIAATAKLKLTSVPNFESLTMPSVHVSAATLIQRAVAMETNAREYEQVFTAAGLPADFLAQLEAARTAVQASLVKRDSHVRARTGATSGLAATEKDAASVIRMLNSQVVRLLGPNEQLLAEWKKAKRVPRKPGPAGAVSASPAQPASPAVSTTAGAAPTIAAPTSTTEGLRAAV